MQIEVQWKFSRAVVAEEYRCRPIIVPFNILTMPLARWYTRRYGDMREKVSFIIIKYPSQSIVVQSTAAKFALDLENANRRPI